MLDNSLMTLLKQILENPTIGVQTFIQMHHLSQRQFYGKLNQLNDYLRSQGFKEISVENQQVVYDKQLETFFLEDIFSNAHQLLFEEKMRVPLIYLYTFIRQEPVSNFHFQWLLRVSKNTVLTDMKQVRNECLNHHVQFIYSRKQGYHLTGTEMDKRYIAMLCLYEILRYPIGKKALHYLLESWKITPRFDAIAQVIKEQLAEVRLQIPTSRLEQLSFFYQLILIRQAATLSFSDRQLDVLKQHPLVQTAHQIAVHFNRHSLSETYYLTAQLLAVVEGNRFDNTLAILEPHIHTIINYIEHHMVVHFDKPIDLFKGLYLHLLPAYYRLLFDIPIPNELTDLIITDYPFLFDVVKKSLFSLEQALQKSISPQEVAFLTMFFGGKLKQHRHTQTQWHALVVCPNGISASHLLKNQLEQLFPTFQWSVSAYTDKHEAQHVDMIFSTLFMKASVPVYVTKPILSVHEKNYLIDVVSRDFNIVTPKLPTSRDIIAIVEQYATIADKEALYQTLDRYIRQHSYLERKENPMLKDLITPEYIHFSDVSLTWQDALRLACQPLENYGHITDQYVTSIIERVQSFGPYIHIGKGVAIPHARPEDGVKTLGMSFLKLEKPVQLDNKAEHEVDILITLAAVDNTTHLSALSELTKILSDKDKLTQLKQATQIKDVLAIIAQEEENK